MKMETFRIYNLVLSCFYNEAILIKYQYVYVHIFIILVMSLLELGMYNFTFIQGGSKTSN